MKTLRPAPDQFSSITDFPYKPLYVDFEAIRMHYIDEGQGETILALHGEPSWSYLYRKFIPVLGNFRFVAPDLIGFGKSDKLVNWRDYSFELHLRSLEHFIDALDLKDITLVVQDWGGLLGLSLLGAHPDRFKRVLILNTFLPKGKKLPLPFKMWQWFARYHPSLPIGFILQMATATRLNKATLEAYKAPFPNRKHKTGAKAFPPMIPGNPDAPGVKHMNKAREVLSNWTKPALILFSDKDPIMSGLEKFFLKLIPEGDHREDGIIEGASHFLQEDKGKEIAERIDRFMKAH